MSPVSVTRLIVEGVELVRGELVVPPPAARHARVARVGPGEQVEVLDLAGGVGAGRLLAWERGACRVAIESVVHDRGEPPKPLRLALAVLHTAAFDWAVEKATELGATDIVPVISQLVQGGRHVARVERWRRVAVAAVAQCGRSRAPVVSEPRGLADVLTSAQGSRLVADPTAVDSPPAEVGSDGITVLVGPEGGFATDELVAIRAAGFRTLPLGPRTLRAETAAVAALAVVQDRLGWQ
jgi:16S rRNA (uracil1498-N3)-methyltransferase